MEEKDKIFKIMVVEDSETQLVILRHVLELEGWRVTGARSAEEALTLLSGLEAPDAPDLVIVDYRLPGIQGDELCRRLKMNVNTRSIPILMLTAEEGEASETHSLESGADDFLHKNVDDAIMVLKIKSLLRQSEESRVILGIGSPLFRGSRVLAVDSDPGFLKFLEKSFKEEGLRVDTCQDCNQALAMMEKETYDCLMTGLDTAGSDTVDICKTIDDKRRSINSPLESPMVLALTASEDTEEMSRALESGADDFVAKSGNISVIKSRLMALLRRKFIQEDNYRIFEELKRKELEVERSRIEKSAAEAKARLASRLLETVEQLEDEIEERKRMELAIKNYSRQLERSNKELESFAYVASHDLQEPLRAISSYLQLIEKRYNDKLDEKGRDFIQRAVGGARRMQDMISDLLVYSRLTTRAKPFCSCPFEDLLDRVLTNLSAAVERSGAVITHDELPEIPCEESHILRLFQNLLSNAIKFCDKPHPEIHISAVPLKLTPPARKRRKKKQEEHWQFSIKDNGIGIAPGHRENIFKIFHRLHGRGQYPGTGIGLAICQKIVALHGGKIWVESEPGSGSTFFFTINTEIVMREEK